MVKRKMSNSTDTLKVCIYHLTVDISLMPTPALLQLYVNSSTHSLLSHTSQNCTIDSTAAHKQSASHVYHVLLAPQPLVSFSQVQLTCTLWDLLHFLSDTPALFQLQNPFFICFIIHLLSYTYHKLTTPENTSYSNLSAPSSAGVVSREEY